MATVFATVKGPNSQTATVKLVRRGVYIMRHDQSTAGRARWGNLAEIRQDMAHFVRFGALPPIHGQSWF